MTEQPKYRGSLDTAFLTDDPDVVELILVRHGKQDIDYSLSAKVADIVDPPLTELGRRQAELVGERFMGHSIDAVYSSQLSRAHDTGIQIARHHGLEVIVDEALEEVKIWRDLPQDKPAVDVLGRQTLLGLRARMVREGSWDVYPHSETSHQFRNRVVTAIEGIAAVNERRRVVVACHGGVINAYVGWVLGLDRDMWFRPSHTAVSCVRVGSHGRRALQYLGDVQHLERVDPSLVTQ